MSAFSRQRGATLIEVMVTLAIAGVVLVAITRLTTKAGGALTRAEAQSELESANRIISENLRASLASNILLVADYGAAHPYAALRDKVRASAAAAGAPAPVTHSAPAVVLDRDHVPRSTGYDTAAERALLAASAGNELIFVSTIQPLTLTAWVQYPCATCTSGVLARATPSMTSTSILGQPVSIDRIQFVYIYLAKENRPLRGGLFPLRLVEWRSQPYATYSYLQQASGALLTSTADALVQAGYSTAVDTAHLLELNAGYYSVASSGAVTLLAGPANFAQGSWSYLDEFNLHQDYRTARTDYGRLRRRSAPGGMAGAIRYSVAYNTPAGGGALDPAREQVLLDGLSAGGGQIRVPLYAQEDRGGAGFPAGFEVVIVGRTGAREILARRVLMASAASASRQLQRQYLAQQAEDYITVENQY
jgi:prepilin-type N-terminal cleavage/methylation domain-containing protein